MVPWKMPKSEFVNVLFTCRILVAVQCLCQRWCYSKIWYKWKSPGCRKVSHRYSTLYTTWISTNQATVAKWVNCHKNVLRSLSFCYTPPPKKLPFFWYDTDFTIQNMLTSLDSILQFAKEGLTLDGLHDNPSFSKRKDKELLTFLLWHRRL